MLIVEGVIDVAAVATSDDEPEVAQKPQLLADGRLFHGGPLRELADGARAVAQLREQAYPAWRGEGLHELGYTLGGFGTDTGGSGVVVDYVTHPRMLA